MYPQPKLSQYALQLDRVQASDHLGFHFQKQYQAPSFVAVLIVQAWSPQAASQFRGPQDPEPNLATALHNLINLTHFGPF